MFGEFRTKRGWTRPCLSERRGRDLLSLNLSMCGAWTSSCGDSIILWHSSVVAAYLLCIGPVPPPKKIHHHVSEAPCRQRRRCCSALIGTAHCHTHAHSRMSEANGDHALAGFSSIRRLPSEIVDVSAPVAAGNAASAALLSTYNTNTCCVVECVFLQASETTLTDQPPESRASHPRVLGSQPPKSVLGLESMKVAMVSLTAQQVMLLHL